MGLLSLSRRQGTSLRAGRLWDSSTKGALREAEPLVSGKVQPPGDGGKARSLRGSPDGASSSRAGICEESGSLWRHHQRTPMCRDPWSPPAGPLSPVQSLAHLMLLLRAFRRRNEADCRGELTGGEGEGRLAHISTSTMTPPIPFPSPSGFLFLSSPGPPSSPGPRNVLSPSPQGPPSLPSPQGPPSLGTLSPALHLDHSGATWLGALPQREPS